MGCWIKCCDESQSHLPVFRVDAFTAKGFLGNVACVMPLVEWLDDEELLHIAADNGVPETAYTVKSRNGTIALVHARHRMDLCGHATLAAGHIVLTELEPDSDFVAFSSVSGPLKVSRKDGKYAMRLPLREPQPAELPDAIRDALNIQPLEVLKARDYVLVYDNQEDVANIAIDRPVFDQINLGTGGVIVTARISCDFVSRFFTPQATILEDPVTGSAHSLTPIAKTWAKTTCTPGSFRRKAVAPLLDPRRDGRNRGCSANVGAGPPRGELSSVRRVLLAWQHSSLLAVGHRYTFGLNPVDWHRVRRHRPNQNPPAGH